MNRSYKGESRVIQVLIVDDEKSIREGLKYLIDWEESGYEVCAVARNGVEALEIIRNQTINLVITDIRMPIMNGLELIKAVKEEIQAPIEFIILSGYEEFEYAKQAILLGARGYLLKPIEEIEMYQLLEKIKKQYDKELKDREKEKWIQLQEILKYKGTQQMEYLAYFHSKQYYYVSIRIDRDETEESLLEAIGRKIGEENLGYVVVKQRNFYDIVIGDEILTKFEDNIELLCNELYDEISKEFYGKITILVGKKVECIQEIGASYQSIQRCRKKFFYEGYGTIIMHDKIEDVELEYAFQDYKYLEELCVEIEQCNYEATEHKIYRLCQQLKNNKVEINLVRMYVNYIILGLEKWFIGLGYSKIELDPIQYHELIEIQEDITIKQVEQQMKIYCRTIINEFECSRKKSDLGVVGEILDYISVNYSEDLNIRMLANKYYLNASYLGQLFRKKVGIGFNKYLHKIRIEESKKLLGITSMKIYEIAYKVGYDDPNYYVTKFIEIEGISPSYYRKNTI